MVPDRIRPGALPRTTHKSTCRRQFTAAPNREDPAMPDTTTKPTPKPATEDSAWSHQLAGGVTNQGKSAAAAAIRK